jgi:DNA-binding NtrC family response regulator
MLKSIDTILVVDDELNTREGLKQALEEEGYVVLTAETGEMAKNILTRQKINLIVTDLMMPGIDGLEILKFAHQLAPEMAIIIITGFGTIETAVKAMKDGAYDFLTKPIDIDKLSALVEKALMTQKLLLENIYLKEKLRNRYRFEQIIGKSRQMREIFELIEQVSPSKTTILIEGESGTGKELFANAIHQLSPRCDKPFIKISCAALSEGLLESELFGHVKGAFTGACENKKGRFELAHQGTLFLDEIGTVPPHIQVKLLRVLQEREFEKVGGEKTISVDVRLVVATNSDLAEAVNKGLFREDLYYRLNVIIINIPPLRERIEDIPLLTEYFIDKFSQENKKDANNIDPETLDLLMEYNWPGNIRELRNCIESAVVRTKCSTISLHDLPPYIKHYRYQTDSKITLPLGTTLEEIEKQAILKTLTATRGNKIKAANMLKIGVKTLYRKLNRYNNR